MQHLVAPPLLPSALLAQVAEELLRCRAILSRIEHSVHAVIDSHPASSETRAWHRNLQDIDLLEQNLADLARCLCATSAEPALQGGLPLSAVGVLGDLTLDDLRQRLRGHTQVTESGGEIEYF
jgi:hypothetical protein